MRGFYVYKGEYESECSDTTEKDWRTESGSYPVSISMAAETMVMYGNIHRPIGLALPKESTARSTELCSGAVVEPSDFSISESYIAPGVKIGEEAGFVGGSDGGGAKEGRGVGWGASVQSGGWLATDITPLSAKWIMVLASVSTSAACTSPNVNSSNILFELKYARRRRMTLEHIIALMAT